MSNHFQRAFRWCAGTDEQALQDCPQSQYIKQAGYGSLVLIPTVLAFISMSYTISTLTPDKYKYFGIAVVWSLIVFTFDRFIISTFRKAESSRKEILSGAFLGRLSLAVVVGIIIAHPLVMFIFQPSVSARMEQIRQRERQAIYDRYENEIKEYEQQKTSTTQAMSVEEAAKDAKRAELYGQFSQALRLHRRRWGALMLRQAADKLTEEKKVRMQQFNDDKEKIDNKIAELKETRDRGVLAYNQATGQATDYLARERALSELMAENRTVFLTNWFIILLFVVLDVLPITFKVLTKKEAYDVLVESLSLRVVEKSKKDDEIHTHLLEQTTTTRKLQIDEIIKSESQEPSFFGALKSDIERVIKQSLFFGNSMAKPAAVETLPRVPTELVKLMNDPAPAKQGLFERLRTKLNDKTIDVLIGVTSLPFQAVALFAFSLYADKSVWQYVSWSTTLEVFGLFVLNCVLSGVAKLFVH
ncbi:MAG: DUF4407 domain-containing protein [Blastocatellia bacterium]